MIINERDNRTERLIKVANEMMTAEIGRAHV